MWYLAELNIDGVKFRQCSSRQQVNEKGASSGGNSDAENFTTKY